MTTAVLNLQSLAELSAERILNCAVEGMVVALLAAVVLRALGRQNSGTRFAVWFAALLGIAALPLLGAWTSSAGALAKRPEIILAPAWALYIFAAWLVIAAAGLFRVGLGFWHVRRLRRSCRPVEISALDPLLQKTLREFQPAGSVTLCVSDRLRVPAAIGFARPIVAIPSWALKELSTDELNAVLLHELAHLRRRDDWTNLVQKILGALLFFHPAVWWIEKKMALEREMACDDMVLAHVEATSPRAYAECLVALAERSFLRRGFAMAQAAVDRVRNVSLRVSRILDVNRPRMTRVWRPAPALLTAVSMLCLAALSYTPARLVSFESGAALAPAATVAAGGFEANPAWRMGARVVPAKLQVRPPVSMHAQKSAAAISEPKVSFGNDSGAFGAPLAAVRRPARPAMFIRASLAGKKPAPPALFLVMRTEVVRAREYDASGAIVWDLCVWRVTLVDAAPSKMDGGVAAKSI